MATGGYNFPYLDSWAGEDGGRAVLATEVRVARAGGQIIEATAPQANGWGTPRAEAAITAASAEAQRGAGGLAGYFAWCRGRSLRLGRRMTSAWRKPNRDSPEGYWRQTRGSDS